MFCATLAQADVPDIAIRLSLSTLTTLIKASLPEEMTLTKPTDGSFRVSGVEFDPVVPGRLNISGTLFESKLEPALPVAAIIDVSIAVQDQSVRLSPILTDARVVTKDIPWSQPITLLKAWMLSSLAFTKPELEPIDLPIQRHLDLASKNKEIRSRQSFGKATAEVVASAQIAASTLTLYVERASLGHDGLRIALHQEPRYAGNPSVDWSAMTTDSTVNTLFLSGSFLAEVLNRVAGVVTIPFYLENPRGKIDGHSSNTLLGRKEWYIEFQGQRPLSGLVQANTVFTWRDRLVFSSQMSLRARGKIHGHGDPGPGGGCGVHPAVLLDGTATVNGYLDVAVGDKYIALDMRTQSQPQTQLQYKVDRVNICGIVTKGPYSGAFHVTIPDSAVSTTVHLEPLVAELPDGTPLVSHIVDLKTRTDGYEIQFKVGPITP